MGLLVLVASIEHHQPFDRPHSPSVEFDDVIALRNECRPSRKSFVQLDISSQRAGQFRRRRAGATGDRRIRLLGGHGEPAHRLPGDVDVTGELVEGSAGDGLEFIDCPRRPFDSGLQAHECRIHLPLDGLGQGHHLLFDPLKRIGDSVLQRDRLPESVLCFLCLLASDDIDDQIDLLQVLKFAELGKSFVELLLADLDGGPGASIPPKHDTAALPLGVERLHSGQQLSGLLQPAYRCHQADILRGDAANGIAKVGDGLEPRAADVDFDLPPRKLGESLVQLIDVANRTVEALERQLQGVRRAQGAFDLLEWRVDVCKGTCRV